MFHLLFVIFLGFSSPTYHTNSAGEDGPPIENPDGPGENTGGDTGQIPPKK